MYNDKVCSYCKEVKPFSDFFKDKRKKDGLYSRCKECFNSIQRSKINQAIEDGSRPHKKYTRMSNEVKQKILELYGDGNGTHIISKEVGFKKSSVLKFLTKRGVIRKGATYRKFKFKNENYFDCIDSDDKAYFLGLLWADGCNYRNDNNKAYQIVISLQERDGYILRKLANKIFENDDIVKGVSKISDYDNYQRQPQTTLRIPSKHISNTLLNYGMIPKKSSTLKMPIGINWSDDLYRSFLRGFYDGDGGIYFNNNSKNYGCSIISGVEHINEMYLIIEKYVGKKMSLEVKTNYKVPMAYLRLHGNYVVYRFLTWLYKDSTIHLDRKYLKYLDLKCIVESNH